MLGVSTFPNLSSDRRKIMPRYYSSIFSSLWFLVRLNIFCSSFGKIISKLDYNFFLHRGLNFEVKPISIFPNGFRFWCHMLKGLPHTKIQNIPVLFSPLSLPLSLHPSVSHLPLNIHMYFMNIMGRQLLYELMKSLHYWFEMPPLCHVLGTYVEICYSFFSCQPVYSSVDSVAP